MPKEDWPLAVRLLEGKDANLDLVKKGLAIGQELTNKHWEKVKINWESRIQGLEKALESKNKTEVTVNVGVSPLVYLFIFLTAILVYVATRY